LRKVVTLQCTTGSRTCDLLIVISSPRRTVACPGNVVNCREGGILRTFDALVRRLEVRLEVLGARLVLGELGIRDAYLTSSAAGASCVGELENVRLAAEVTVVEFHAATDAHTAVMRSRHDNHLVESTSRVERLRFTERRVIRRPCNCYST